MSIFDHREKKQIAQDVLDRMTGEDIIKERAAEELRIRAINAAAQREYERQQRLSADKAAKQAAKLGNPRIKPEERPGLNRREE
jgi:precorrin isomerase